MIETYGTEQLLEDLRAYKRQIDLADEYIAEEDVLREIQLRAVIVAGEHAGARAEPVDSARKPTPRKGASMKIEICNEEGVAKATVTHGEERLTDTISVEPGHTAAIKLGVDTPPDVVVESPTPNNPTQPTGDGAGEAAATAGEGEGGATGGEGGEGLGASA